MSFHSKYPEYPSIVYQEKLCIISESDVPSGSGGINREGYTYGELRHKPIISEILDTMIRDRTLRKFANECNERNAREGFEMFCINGEYCFWGLRLGPIVKTPTLDELKQILLSNPKTSQAVAQNCVTPRMIRDVSYRLLRKEIARQCNISEKEAGLAIGNQLDCVPHEDLCGYIYMVPNWAHYWFRHNGYVSNTLAFLNR